jgi:small acid-soluble spore protein F (minor alpha/beta-type SASP)
MHVAELLSPEAMDVMARELGVAAIVSREGWGGVPARECGRVVREAVRIAEEALARRAGFEPRGGRGPAGF